MTIYLLLLLCIVLLMLWDGSKYTFRNDGKKSERALLLAMSLIYLLCVLRASSVGRDIPGYQTAYELTKKMPWSNFSYIYFENGYILLMKICNGLNLSFQMYFVVLYVIILLPVFTFIRDYSDNKLMSLLIFVCYIIFEFDLTGLRQALAISIVLLAFQVLLAGKKGKNLKYILMVLLAATIHKSALIALVFLPLVSFVKSLRWYTVAMLIAVAVSMGARQYLFGVISVIFDRESFADRGLNIGGNIIFMCAVTIMSVYVYDVQRKTLQNGATDEQILQYQREIFMLKAFMFGIVLSLFFGEATTARSYMYFSIVTMVLIPNVCAKFERKNRILIEGAFVIFFIVFFYFNSLKANNFDIVPYRFFWEN